MHGGGTAAQQGAGSQRQAEIRRPAGGEVEGAVAPAEGHVRPAAQVAGKVGGWQPVAPVDGGGIALALGHRQGQPDRSEEHTSELQSLMRSSYAVCCLKKTKNTQ